MNTTKTFLLMIGLVLLFMGIGYLVGRETGMFFAFGIACLMNFFSYWYSDKIVLKMYRAREIQERDHPRLFRVVKAVAQKAMIPMPKVYIIPTKAANAFATGRNPEHAAVAATEGILELLNEDELEGVIGHEVGHILNRDILVATMAATMAGAIGIIAHMAQFAAIFGGGGDNRRGNPIGLLVTAILAPIVATIIQLAISRQREYKADETSGRITGKFLPLASALEKLHRAPVKMNLDESPSTAHLMIANPLSGKGLTSLFSTHPPVEKRVARLKEMANSDILSMQGYGR